MPIICHREIANRNQIINRISGQKHSILDLGQDIFHRRKAKNQKLVLLNRKR